MTPFSAIFVPDELQDAVSDRAWLRGCWTRSARERGCRDGLVTADAAARIGAACRAELYDPRELAQEGRAVGNPASPSSARCARPSATRPPTGPLRATSQDIVDTAAMLVSRRAVVLVLAELDRLADACADLARTHRSTPLRHARCCSRQCQRHSD